MSEFSDRYKLPQWQKKRLEIMERDKYACRRCREENKTLNVHHMYYRRDAMPWEYPDKSLVTLCEGCHKIVESWIFGIKESAGLSWRFLPRIYGYIAGLRSMTEGRDILIPTADEVYWNCIQGIADFFKTGTENIDDHFEKAPDGVGRLTLKSIQIAVLANSDGDDQAQEPELTVISGDEWKQKDCPGDI